MDSCVRHTLSLVVLFLSIPGISRSQESSVIPDSGAVAQDSLQSGLMAIHAPRQDTTIQVVTKSAGVAMVLSAALPGAGQVYNGSYWKAPIIAGLGVYFISQWIQNNNRVQEYRDQGNTSLRDFYKKERDKFTWYFTILYLLNIADAYVDAALYGFNVSDDLSIRILPGETEQVACVRLQILF